MNIRSLYVLWIFCTGLLWCTATLNADVKQMPAGSAAAPPVLKVQIEQAESAKPKGGFSDALKSITDLVSALAWPAIVVVFLIWYRKQVGQGLGAVISKLPQAEGFEFGPLKIALSKSAVLATDIPVSPDAQDQRDAMKLQNKLAKDLRDEVAQSPEVLPEIRRKMDELARQYELLRAARDSQNRKASDAEIVQMNKMVSQMRALAISCAPYWKEYADSARQGDRLAAVVIVQMSPDPKYLDWLRERFRVDRPFIFYHAALALQNLADQCWTEARDKITETAQSALEQVKSFPGEPDKKTVDILESILKRG